MFERLSVQFVALISGRADDKHIELTNKICQHADSQ